MAETSSDFHLNNQSKIAGTVNCLDRVIIQGSLSAWGCPYSINSFLITQGIKITEYRAYAFGKNNAVRARIEKVALENNCHIVHINSPKRFDKEYHIQQILLKRGNKEGIVQIYSSMEICDCYKENYDKANNKCSLVYVTSKCLHYYIYFIDRQFGLCFIRIPTYIPFRIQFYMNGHNYLANKLEANNISFKMEDNAFSFISDYDLANKLSNDIRAEDIHASLDAIIKRYIPFLEETKQVYRWTISQAEYSTDIIFNNDNELQLLYDQLVINCIHAVKPGNVATFFSRKLAPKYKQDVGGNFNLQIQGTRIKHHMGVNSIKMYNKGKNILRIETTINKITEFKIYRMVSQRDGKQVRKLADMKKSIYSLFDLCKCCQAANFRYLDYIATFDDYSEGKKNIDKLSQKVNDNGRSSRGFNLFDPTEAQILLATDAGEFNINGFRNKDIRNKLNNTFSPHQTSQIIKRLLLHKIIKKVKNTYKYYLTKFGKQVLAGAHIVKELLIIPALAV